MSGSGFRRRVTVAAIVERESREETGWRFVPEGLAGVRHPLDVVVQVGAP